MKQALKISQKLFWINITFLGKNEKELCLFSEGRLLSYIKCAEQICEKSELSILKRESFFVVWQMYKKSGFLFGSYGSDLFDVE